MRLSLLAFSLLAFAIGNSVYADTNIFENDARAEESYKKIQDLFTKLDNNTFDQVMHGGRQEFGLIFFCSSNSKFCNSFLARFLLMRLAAPNWSTMLKFYDVDCAEKSNKKLCRQHGFRFGPVLKYYKPQSSNGDLGEKIPAFSNADKMLTEVVKKINEDYPTAGCTTCPNLTPLPDWVHDPKQLWDMRENYCAEQITLVPVESMDEIDGITTLIHAEKVYKGFPTWRVLKSNTQLLDPHNTGESLDGGAISGYRIDEDAAERCKQRGGHMNLEIGSETERDSDEEIEHDEFNVGQNVNMTHIDGLFGKNTQNGTETPIAKKTV